MNFILDTHTHTISSGHAYHTMSELIDAGQKKGLKLLAITDHAPAMPGSSSSIYFRNFRVIPRQYGEFELFMGTEANLIDYNGTLDLEEEILKGLDIVIASLHPLCIKPGTMEQNTNALICAMKNPYVHIIGHPDDSRYPLDYERLIKEASHCHILIEINNSSLNPAGFRQDSYENDKILLQLCKKYQVPIVLGSDAHVAQDVGNFSYIIPLLEELLIPEELIINTSVQKLKHFLAG